jgi:hypothetical protein
VTLREATAERGRLRSALGPKLTEIPAPVVELRLEAWSSRSTRDSSSHSSRPRARRPTRSCGGAPPGARERRRRRGRRGRGGGAMVAHPETRALVVPRDVR